MEHSVEKAIIERYGILERPIPTSDLEIAETISELSYLTHSHFRYYGKFPSKLASHFLDRYATPEAVLLDNYVGSGTSLVEAQLRGIPSYGIDINPLAVLASNTKTTCFSESELIDTFTNLEQRLRDSLGAQKNSNLENIPEWKAINKWFSDKAIQDLALLKNVLTSQEFPRSEVRDFFWLGFVGIIRRVSKAHDAEIRPHVNPKKRERDVIEAYKKKVVKMIENSIHFAKLVPSKAKSKTYLHSNVMLGEVSDLKKAGINLVLSHPPYLNCFDYIPVYGLEFQWIIDVPFLWDGRSLKEIKEMENKSWPATSEKILYGYFDTNRRVYEEVFRLMEPGGVCGLVIGDSTIKGELIRVHKILAAICEDIGFETEEIIYRSTHYGAGKYAYKDRADYHNNGEGKKDGIVVLRKPKK